MCRRQTGTITRVALLRYEGQGSELSITWPGDAQAAQSAFARAHQALNGFTLEAKVELVTLRVEAEGIMPAPARHSLAKGNGAEPIGQQIMHEATGSVEASVYDRAALGAGDRLAGPAIVTQLDATTLVARGWQAEVLSSGALLLRRVDDSSQPATGEERLLPLPLREGVGGRGRCDRRKGRSSSQPYSRPAKSPAANTVMFCVSACATKARATSSRLASST